MYLLVILVVLVVLNDSRQVVEIPDVVRVGRRAYLVLVLRQSEEICPSQILAPCPGVAARCQHGWAVDPRVARHDLQQLMEQEVTAVLGHEVGVNARVVRFPEIDGDYFDEEAG
jgi:hypothetical protein